MFIHWFVFQQYEFHDHNNECDHLYDLDHELDHDDDHDDEYDHEYGLGLDHELENEFDHDREIIFLFKSDFWNLFIDLFSVNLTINVNY